MGTVFTPPAAGATGAVHRPAAASAGFRPAAAGQAERSQGASARLQRALRALVAMPDGPPGVIAIVQRGGQRKVYTAGIANATTRTPLSLGQHMRMASASKAFSGAVALSLVSRGVLHLGDTIGRVLPSLPRAWAAVTLRELLQHTSGLPDFTASKAFHRRVRRAPRTPIAPRKLLGFVAGKRLQFIPGTQYKYDNSDNIAVAMMARAATRKSYDQLLRNLVYRALGLARTSLPAGSGMPRPYMHGYARSPGQPLEDVSTAFAGSLSWASGGLVSTPADWNTFIRGYAGARLFSRAVQAQQLRVIPGSSGPAGPGRNSAGLGIFRYRTRCGTVYGHTGNILGYTQFAGATRTGRDSVTVSATEQVNETHLAGVYRALRRAEGLAVCAALRPRR
ncbi:MAG TPA: serine hydrolase domain-containing protein [Streptosporangiaceae bacterium]|nr:serine hydrolase domain-containing protein [Streptosporangiaceae bacterium]